MIADQTNAIFAEYDFLLMPAAPTPAWSLGESLEDPVAMYLADIFTVQANVVGNPAVSIPNGTDAQGLPMGLQIMGKPFGEAELLAFSKYVLEGTPVGVDSSF